MAQRFSGELNCSPENRTPISRMGDDLAESGLAEHPPRGLLAPPDAEDPSGELADPIPMRFLGGSGHEPIFTRHRDAGVLAATQSAGMRRGTRYCWVEREPASAEHRRCGRWEECA
jgi:hypothetical protein